MSQPRRSQRLAGRRVELVPVLLDSDSDSTLSIGIRCEVCGSEDPGVVHVPCCNFAAHRQCLTHDAEVSCPYCGMDLQPVFDPQSSQGSDCPSCGRDLGNCVVCTEVMTRENSIEVPYCHQAFHVTCLARSFSSCGLQCPLCNQSLAEFSMSSSFPASSFFHGCMIDVDRPPHQSWVEFYGASCWVFSTSRDASVPLLPSNWPASPV